MTVRFVMLTKEASSVAKKGVSSEDASFVSMTKTR